MSAQRNETGEFEPQLSRFYLDEADTFEIQASESGGEATDQDIESVVKELIDNSKKFKNDKIEVHVFHADVTLDGEVMNEDEKYAIGSLVQLIHGVGMIRNRLVVSKL